MSKTAWSALMGQGESAIDCLRRLADSFGYEEECILTDCPTIEALLDFRALWDIYGTEYWNGVVEAIGEGDDPKPALRFVRKHKMPDAWRRDIRHAMQRARKADVS